MITAKEFRIIGTFIHLFCTFFGVSTNILLIVLVLRTKISELKQNRRIIIQFAVFDIINSIILFCVAPVLLLIDGVEFFFQGSFFRGFSYSINQAGILMWLLFHFFSLSVVPIQFAYRYFSLCKNVKVTQKTYASLFIIPAVFSLAHLLVSYFTLHENQDYSGKIMETLQLFFEDDSPRDHVIMVIGQKVPSDVIISNSLGIFIAIVSYSFIFYYGYKINSFLKMYSASFSQKTAKMHQSLNRVLFIQALTPFLFLILPTLITLICSFLKITTSPNFVLCMIVIAFPPFINAAFTLITLKPLRAAFCNCGSRTQVLQASSLQQRKLFTIPQNWSRNKSQSVS